MGLHEVVVITPSNTTAFSKALNRLLPRRFRKCDGCNRRERNCTCRFQFFRGNGVAEQYLAGVGESVVTVTRAGVTGGLLRHQHHHNTGASPAPHCHHHHHQQQQQHHPIPGVSSTLSATPSHPLILSHIIPAHTQLSTPTESSPTSRGVDHPSWVPTPVHASPQFPHPCQQRGTGGGVRRPSGDFSLVASSLHNHHHQHCQGRPPLTTTTTTTTTTDMPVNGLGSLSTGGNCGGGSGPISPPPTTTSLLPPPPPTTTTTITTTTIFDSNTNNIINNNHHNNNNQLNLHPFDTTSSTTSSSISNTNTSSISASSRCPPLHDLHDYAGDGSEGDNYQTGSGDGSECEPCLIQLEERLIKSYPIWFLPDLQRSGAVHLLQGKDEGNFIVRQSSQLNTRALSVRLPPDKGPYIQHYLIEIHNDGSSYSLEASENRFDTLPSLIAYYSQCCDELPVQLKLPHTIQEAKTRHELSSLSLLGQEFWGTVMASPTASTPTAESHQSNAPTPSPRPHDLSFSSFGKGGVTRGTSSTSLLSPQTLAGVCVSGGSLGSSGGGSTSPLTPVRPAPPLPSPGDRSSLNLNLAPLEEFLKEQPTFTSFRSQPATPVSQLKPSTPGTKPVPPPRSSPPGVQRTSQISPPSSQRLLSKPVPAARFSPPIGSDIGTPTSENGEIVSRQSQAPVPPPRWARPCITTSPSNITVTTTLTLNVNQVKALPLQVDESQEGMTVHISNLEISPSNSNTSPSNALSSTPNGNQSGTLNGYRDGLHLQIRQQITSPQSTPCTPCGPSTPVGEEGMSRVRMRNGKRDKRRHSNHYHEANIIDSSALYCRSSVVDKMSDYEDLWSSPPREMPSTPSPSQPKMLTFKPRNEISKSMGDLSEIAKNSKSTHFTYNAETNAVDECTANNEKNGNGNSTDSISSYRKNSSPFYMEPADALKELQPQARINKASNVMPKKVNNRYSDSNIQWKTRKSHNSLGIIDSNEDLPSASSTENLANLANGRANEISNIKTEEETNRNIETEKNKVNARHLANGQGRSEVRRHSKLGGRGKPIAPPKIGTDSHTSNGDQNADIGCHLASSWEYHLHGSDTEDIQGGESRFPVDDNGESDSVIIPGERTVQDLISEKHPDLMPSDVQSIAPSSITRISEYDNVGNHGANFREDQHQKAVNHKTSRSILPEERIHPPLPTHYFPSTVSDSGTEFSEPWDSRKWETFMHSEDDSSVDHYPRSLTATPALCTNVLEDSDMGGAGVTDSDSFVHVTGGENVAISDEETGSISRTPTLSLAHAHNLDTQQRSRIMSPQLLALRHRQDAENGVAIRAYAVDLGNDTSTTFSQAVSHFITCTLESPEKDPSIVTRNVRQFMSGMKNYLVTSGEKEFEAIVKKQQSNLKATEFLNLDAILEDVLVRLVLRPLWNHINKLFVDAYSANGSIQQLASNMKYARSQQYIRLGIKAELSPPSGTSLDTIRSLLTRMQKVYAPREKLESLLATISHIYQAMYENGNTSGSGDADDLVPMIMWVLCQSGMVSAEVEADYMWGLLLPSASSGEASYYLEAFHSAIHALKNLSPSPESSPGNSLDSVKPDLSVVSDQGIMKIVIPDEKNGSIVTRTLPIRPATTTREVCKMMAHKLKVTNPQDYGLYKLVDGLESLLADNECPHKVKSDLSTNGFHCTFAFKRIDAKIAWPILT